MQDIDRHLQINGRRTWSPLALLALVGVVAVAGAAGATANDALRHFYEDITSISANFRQVVLDEGLNPIEEASGTMLIKRPGRFRWDYEPPTEQQIVSDGRRVWIYDVELEQVTVRPLAKTLGRTPASLLAGGRDIHSSFEVSELPATGAISWVRMKPKQSDTGFEDIRIGFEDGSVRVMELVDGLGQTTRITLTEVRENPRIADDRFSFSPPLGVDVIDESLTTVR